MPLAQTTDFTSAFNLAQYGILGMVVLLFVLGKIVPGYIHDKQAAEIERLTKELRELNENIQELVQDRVIPALVRSTDVLAHFVEARAREEERK